MTHTSRCAPSVCYTARGLKLSATQSRLAPRKIVPSGDTAPCSAIEEACRGCDVLVHEVYSAARFARLPPEVQKYHAGFHTSTSELAAIASRSKPKLLVLYHQLYLGPSDGVDLRKEIRKSYSGKVVSSRDLDLF